MLITDSLIFKLDPRKQYQRKKSPLELNHVTGVSVSPALDQGFAVHFQNGKDLLCYMVTPHNDDRVAELIAVLCQICHRSECTEGTECTTFSACLVGGAR